jgi:hypothetical protein
LRSGRGTSGSIAAWALPESPGQDQASFHSDAADATQASGPMQCDTRRIADFIHGNSTIRRKCSFFDLPFGAELPMIECFNPVAFHW